MAQQVPDADPEMNPDTFHETLHPAFVTSAAVTPEIIDDFLRSAAENFCKVFRDDGEAHAFSLQREYADAEREITRIERQGLPMRGTREPVGANPEKLDFAGATVDELASYVLRNFATDEVEERDGYFVRFVDVEYLNEKSERPNIDNRYFVVLDERSARDQSVLVVTIPCQERTYPSSSGAPGNIRNWKPRDDYTNLRIWQSSKDDDEMMAVRIKFKEGFKIDMMRLGEGAIWELAETVDENGVYSEESKQAIRDNINLKRETENLKKLDVSNNATGKGVGA